MPTSRDFWRAINIRAGFPASEPERRLINLQGYVKRFKDESSDAERDVIIWDAAVLISNMRAAFGRQSNEVDLDLASDGRWPLLRDLYRGYHQRRPEWSGDWRPLNLIPLLEMDSFPTVKPSRRVQVDFDGRLSFAALMEALRRVWPQLREKDWVRKTRPLGPKSLALIRFVCLEAGIDKTWRERWEEWNKHHEDQADWQFSTTRALASEFYRAEKQLTGERRGLDWFYSSASRRLVESDLNSEVMRELLRSADADERMAAQRWIGSSQKELDTAERTLSRIQEIAEEDADGSQG